MEVENAFNAAVANLLDLATTGFDHCLMESSIDKTWPGGWGIRV